MAAEASAQNAPSASSSATVRRRRREEAGYAAVAADERQWVRMVGFRFWLKKSATLGSAALSVTTPDAGQGRKESHPEKYFQRIEFWKGRPVKEPGCGRVLKARA